MELYLDTANVAEVERLARIPSALWDMAQRQRPMRSMKPCRIS